MAKANIYVPDDRPWFKQYPKDISKHMDYPEKAIFDFVDDAAKTDPEKPAIHFYGKTINYKELKELSDKFAHSLQKAGIKKGDRVAFLMPTCPQFAIGFYGTMKIGAVPVSLNPLYTAEELPYFFKDVEPRIIVTLDMFYDKVQKAAESTPQIEKIIVSNISDYFSPVKRILGKLLGKIKTTSCPKATNFNDFLKISTNYNPVKVNPLKDTAVIIYTGGTTGNPKGIILTHFNIVSNVAGIDNWLKNISTKSLFLVLPVFHIYAINVGLTFGPMRKAKVVMLPKFSIKDTVELVKKQKIEYFLGVPAMFAGISKYLDAHQEQGAFDSVRLCSSGTTPISTYLWKKIESICPNAFIIEGYGLSETSPVVSIDSPSEQYSKKLNSVGVPPPDTDIKIVDIVNRQELPCNQAGEILIKGPQVFKGYWKKPEKTQTAFENGWFRTKDIGRIDEDGTLFIEGRMDDMINVRGEKVWPREVEKVLESHPKIDEVAVVGKKDEYYGQAVKAYVVLKQGAQSSEKQIIEFCKEKLSPPKIPHFVEFFKEIPKTHLGKPLHYKLREREESK